MKHMNENSFLLIPLVLLSIDRYACRSIALTLSYFFFDSFLSAPLRTCLSTVITKSAAASGDKEYVLVILHSPFVIVDRVSVDPEHIDEF